MRRTRRRMRLLGTRIAGSPLVRAIRRVMRAWLSRVPGRRVMRAIRRRLALWLIRGKVRLMRKLIRWDAFWRWQRRRKRVVRLGRGPFFVIRHDDVRDVLARDRDFRVPYLQNLEGLRSPFLLGLPAGEAYDRQRRVLWQALRDPHLPSIKELSITEAKRALVDAKGRIDVVRELTERVLMNTVGTVLGTGPATPTQLAQSRAIFYEVFVNALHNPIVTDEAAIAGAALRAHIAEIVADRCAAVQGRRVDQVDVLGLLVREARDGGLTDDELVNSMLGLFVGWTGPVSRSMGFAFDVLLNKDKREAMRLGHEAALGADDCDAVKSIMREALRFQPSAPALERICARETWIAGRRIPRGSQVIALVNSAMMDEHRISDPRSFMPDRNKAANLHFGDDLHRCIGEQISLTQISAISSVLLAQDVKRAGRLRFEGPFPAQLLVTYGPPR